MDQEYSLPQHCPTLLGGIGVNGAQKGLVGLFEGLL